VTSPKKLCLSTLAAASAMTLLSSCSWHVHRVGLGPVQNQVMESRTQYYGLFGLLALNNVDTGRITTDITSYEVETRYGWWDILLAPILLPLTVTTRTVVVTR